MKVFAVLFGLLLVAKAIAGQTSDDVGGRTWITDVTIVSPEKLDQVRTGSVLIEGDRIVRVERKQSGKKPAGATVISGKVEYLIPGMGFERAAGTEEMIRAYFRQLPRSYLYYGYTTVVDLAVTERKVLEDFRQAPLHP